MRLEKIIAKALENVNDDHYILSLAVAKRAKELAKGREALVDMDKSRYKLTDIALYEIAENRIRIDKITDKDE